ncbi:MAG: phosphoribosylformylglycinamidine cyclo-ligase [Cyanobacteriota bacterium]
MVSKKFTYKDSGVDLEISDQVVKSIQPLAERVRRPEVIADIGPFSGMFELKNFKKPVLVSASDGVGTKLKIAFMVNKHDTIGIDLVAMCINDIITSGAEPLFFLDYIATGKIKPDKITEIVKGIVKGCKIAGCSLIGGETAEMPGLYNTDDYDLAGFAVGAVEKDDIIDSKYVESGDVIIGLASSGLHSNGYSLCRKIFFDEYKLSPFSHINCLNRPLFQELLEPTKIYVNAIKTIKKDFQIKSIANITGGGFIKNIPRSIPKEFQANIYEYSWDIPQIFKVIQNMSGLEYHEMFNIFNMGIGMTLVVSSKDADEILKRLTDTNNQAFQIGKISRLKSKNRVVFINKN